MSKNSNHLLFMRSTFTGCEIFPARIALRTWRQVGRPSPPHPLAPSRCTVVDTCTQPRKWQKHPPPGRVGILTLRRFGVWLGGKTERQTRSTRLLGIEDEQEQITWKELKAVRVAVLSFFPHLAGRNNLLHGDNQAVCHIVAGLTSRSPEMMNELRRL
jgi:hypothetical protein